MFPFSHGNLEFQAMVAAGMSPARALRAATGTAAELLGRTDIGRLEPGKSADIVAMPVNPLADISVTAAVDFVMRAGWILPPPSAERRIRRRCRALQGYLTRLRATTTGSSWPGRPR